MPQDHRNTVELLYQAYARRDFSTFLDLLDPRVELHAAENFIYADGNPYTGRDAVRNGILARLDGEWTGFSVVPEEFLGAGDVMIVRGRYRGTFKETGTAIDAAFVHVFRFTEGRVSAWQTYTDTAQFRDAVSHRTTAGASQ
jgi:ketosteroid isomerase-like protein